jgi:outer membrane protein assembly factor BamD (BamD/ComL family)
VATERSTLAEENALLEHAMTASRAGHSERAVSLLDEHLAKYPDSQLARNAELERLRALERAGNLATARAAARRYLAKYPDGMGSDEARRIALARHPDGSGPPARRGSRRRA